MYKRIVLFFICLGFACGAFAQEIDTTQVEAPAEVPVISYSLAAKKYKIADIKITGIKNYDDFVLIGFSGLSVGDEITVPGEEITTAVKRFWKHGLFSDVKILATKIEGDQIWLEIQLKQRPRISQVNYHGIKKGEREDLEAKLGLKKGFQVTPNVMDRAKIVIQKFFDGKGFKNVDVEIEQKDDPANEGEVIVDINIDKNEKTKIHRIYFEGNEKLTARELKKAMKKTNEKFSLPNDWKTSIMEMFSTKKFTTEEYENDKKNIIAKYNEHGYRDAVLLSDSVANFNEKKVDIFLKVDEGEKYYLKDIRFVGNTQYSTDYLMAVLGMKPGEVYNQKKLNERLSTDEDAVSNVYFNNGYLFFNADPVEVDVANDSISLEIRIQEGPQATINRIIINGNDRLYEDIVRRELRTKPGMLFSRDDLMRSVRELAQMGHFDPENMNPVPLPDPENGTVDIEYNLVSKANDQIEFSAGWGQTGINGKLSLKFTNFSVANLLHPGENYRGILPQGDGQTLTISGQTNAKYYQSYSISFFDPWFGGKRPNSFSVSAFFSVQTDISSRYYNSSYFNNYYNSMYSGYGGYGMYNYGNYNNYENYYDPDKSIKMWGLSVGWGKRLKWPDDYFTLSAELAYQRYNLSDWQYFPVTNGKCNDLSISLTLARNSIDNPIFPRSGSDFSLSVQFTPPYSLMDGKDYKGYYSNPETGSITQDNMNKLHKWIEYHKWKFKGKTYTPLMDPVAHPKCLVLMTRTEFGLLGHYNQYKKSPFGTFDVGGDGMTGYSTYATESIALRGYENSSLTPYGSEGYAYARLGIELRYPLMLETSTNIYVLGFLEAGNAWHDIKKFNPFELKRSAGVGVRIFLPMIGMMGIDWGYGFDKVFGSKQYGGSQFHFILGQEF